MNIDKNFILLKINHIMNLLKNKEKHSIKKRWGLNFIIYNTSMNMDTIQ